MKTVWTKGLDAEKEKEMLREFKEATLLRKRLSSILNEKVKAKHSESRSKDGYANPSWPYFQADAIGYERALEEIISILED
jgi:hypothetical protein